MTNVRFEVLHLDNMPELLAWIPRAISMWFLKTFRDEMWALEDDEDCEARGEFIVHIQVGDERLDTRFRHFGDANSFLSAIHSTPQDTIVLVMLGCLLGEDITAGSRVYRSVAHDLPGLMDRAFMYTAAPNDARAQLGCGEGDPRIIAKPCEPELWISLFVNKLIASGKLKPETCALLKKALKTA